MKFMQYVKKGFTLVELLIVIAIIAILSAVVAPNAFKAIEKSKVAAVESDYKAIKSAALQYYSDTGNWPSSEKAFSEKDSNTGWNGPYIEKWKYKNPWGGEYKWLVGPKDKNGKQDIWVRVTNVPKSSEAQLQNDVNGRSDGKNNIDIVVAQE